MLNFTVSCLVLSFQVHVEFLEVGDKIKVEGPPEEVEKARESLEQQAQELVGRMSFCDINVDAKYHKHIIGKGGSTGEFFQNSKTETLDFPSCFYRNDEIVMRVV